MGESLFDTIKKTVLVPPHAAGWPFIGGGFVATVVFFSFSEFLGFVALILTLFCLYFFRDPARVVPQKSSLILSAADGTISAVVKDLSLPKELGIDDTTEKYTRISTFLSVLDVHVQRAPITGKIIKKIYTPGKFLNADLDKASEDNERCALLIETPSGHKICVVQIAGLIARRIICDVQEGQDITVGHRFGIIRFGSRVDLYLPEDIAPMVCVGQRAIGGETVMANGDSTEPMRSGTLV